MQLNFCAIYYRDQHLYTMHHLWLSEPLLLSTSWFTKHRIPFQHPVLFISLKHHHKLTTSHVSGEFSLENLNMPVLNSPCSLPLLPLQFTDVEYGTRTPLGNPQRNRVTQQASTHMSTDSRWFSQDSFTKGQKKLWIRGESSIPFPSYTIWIQDNHFIP